MGWCYRPGTLAFFDSFAGLIPCKVVSVPKGGPFAGWILSEQTTVDIVAVVTAARGPYRRGECLKIRPHVCVPREQAILRGGQYRVRTNYSWSD
jgi:hypothetical protein